MRKPLAYVLALAGAVGSGGCAAEASPPDEPAAQERRGPPDLVLIDYDGRAAGPSRVDLEALPPCLWIAVSDSAEGMRPHTPVESPTTVTFTFFTAEDTLAMPDSRPAPELAEYWAKIAPGNPPLVERHSPQGAETFEMLEIGELILATAGIPTMLESGEAAIRTYSDSAFARIVLPSGFSFCHYRALDFAASLGGAS